MVFLPTFESRLIVRSQNLTFFISTLSGTVLCNQVLLWKLEKPLSENDNSKNSNDS